MPKGLVRVAVFSVAGLIACLLALFLVGAVIGYLSAGDAAFDVEGALFWAMVVFAVAMMVWAMAVTVGWMRSIDEAAREAHKSAWFWGGCGAMGLGGVFVILAGLPQAAALRLPTFFHGRTDPAAYAASGAFALVLLMVTGYALAWAVWWMKRR